MQCLDLGGLADDALDLLLVALRDVCSVPGLGCSMKMIFNYLSIYLSIYMYTHMFINKYTYTYIYIYIYTYIYILMLSICFV